METVFKSLKVCLSHIDINNVANRNKCALKLTENIINNTLKGQPVWKPPKIFYSEGCWKYSKQNSVYVGPKGVLGQATKAFANVFHIV